MRNRPRRPRFSSRPDGGTANVTSAIGMEETFGRSRARRTSLFTQTVLWITGLVCAALLLGTFAQAWSNNHLTTQVQTAQDALNQVRTEHTKLQKESQHYQDPAVVESEARQQLGYIHPGEQPIVIVDANNKGQQRIVSPTNPLSPQGHWQDWWNLFFAPSR